MLLIRTYVAQSAIEGVGVFAAEPISKGASIWRLDPDFDRLIPMEKYEAAPAAPQGIARPLCLSKPRPSRLHGL